MRKKGTVIRWNEAKGFGFIESPQSNAQVFFHIRDWRGSATPAPRESVSFEEIHVGGKGARAMDVRQEDHQAPAHALRRPQPAATRTAQPEARATQPVARAARPRPAGPARQTTPTGPAFALMLGWVGLLVAGLVLDRLSWPVLPAALLLNLITFFLYWQDKFAASKGQWRTPENTLHLFGLLGGWPGAWFAHQILRHKSAKQAFRNVYWATAVLNVLALAAWVVLPWMPLAR